MTSKILFLFLCISTVAVGQIRYGNQDRENPHNVNISYSNPQEFTIADIEVDGAEFLDKIALISISGLKVGDKIKIPGDGITSAIKKLWKQGLIGDVQIYASKIEGKDVYLIISLAERPRLSRFEFTGITQSQESDIREKISLVRGRVMTDAIRKNAELTIKKYFYEKGYLNTGVGIKYKKDSTVHNSVLLDVAIDKGRKIKIRNVNFMGNGNFSGAKLKSKMKNSSERPRFKLIGALLATGIDRFNPKESRFRLIDDSIKHNVSGSFMEILHENVKLKIFKSSKYVKEKYGEDKASLIQFYNSKGYRDARILADTIIFAGRKSVDINIEVEPGTQYHFRDITWVGNFTHGDRALDRILSIDKGDIYDLDLVNKKLNFNPNGPDISSLYMDNGYLYFSVTPVEVKIDEDSVDLEMRIHEGVQATIRKVFVTGNDRTNDHVIMRELRTLPGQKFSRAEIIRTQRELSQLGYFDPEQVNPKPLPSPTGETVDIEWALVERPSDQIELSGGWGGPVGFIGTLGLTFNNFSLRNIPHFDKWRPLPIGDGQKLSLRLQANGKRYQSYSVSFSEPWIGGKKPHSFGVSLNYSVQRSIDFFTERTIGSLQVLGATVSLGRRVQWPDDYFTLSNSLSYLRYNLFNYGNSLGFGTGVAKNFTFNTIVARNSIDNPMYPRVGSSISLSLALTPPWSLWSGIDYANAPPEEKYQYVEYHKWMFDAKYYMQIAGDLVLSARAHMGFMGAYQKEVGVGPFERFQLGGDGLTGTNFLLGNDIIGLRGYENNSITPFDPETKISGGNIYNKFVMELRYPVSLNPSATIYLLAFSEAGNNWNGFENFNPNRLYSSSGFGARVFMPAFGLLGIDWGYGYGTLPGQSTNAGSQIHFSIGQQIR